MSGELQSIPARHGVATFVPKGQVIKIINTYGKQVVDTWIFALPKPPDKKEMEEEEKESAEQAKKAAEQVTENKQDTKDKSAEAEEEAAKQQDDTKQKVEQDDAKKAEDSKENSKKTEPATDAGTDAAKEQSEEKGDETKEDTTQGEEAAKASETEDAQGASKKGWSSYLPSMRRGKSTNKTEQADNEKSPTDGSSKRWSFFPSYSKPAASDPETAAQDAANSKKWSSYFPSGQGFSNYLPSKESVSNFTSMHQRDPTKSIAEQLYDFSKTPVGAATLSGIFEPRPMSKQAVAR
jgi:hypothetical protein